MNSHTTPLHFSERLALRVDEAASVSGLSRSTIYKLLSGGRLRQLKVGGRRLILSEDLRDLLRPAADGETGTSRK